MKVLQLGKFYPVRGGVEKVMYDLTAGLSAQGVQCDMLCAARDGKTRVIEHETGMRIFCCHTWYEYAATMLSPRMILQLRSICKGYDIIHVHHPDPMACLALFLSGFRGRVILHWHSDIVKQKKLLFLYLPLQDWLLHRADQVVGTSPVYVEQSPYLQEVQHKCVTLPIGIQPVRFAPEAAERVRRRYSGRKIVLSVGRLVAYKGYPYLIAAAKRLPDDYVVLISGTGALENSLRAQIASEGLADKVKMLGRLNDTELHAHYGACDVFCLPSVQKTEAFGIVQIEAMSCGKPVVATTIPQSGVAWVNEHGVSGLNVPPCDAAALADAILQLTRDEATYRRYSEQALNRYRTLFTRENMINQCLTFYRNEHKLSDRI